MHFIIFARITKPQHTLALHFKLISISYLYNQSSDEGNIELQRHATPLWRLNERFIY